MEPLITVIVPIYNVEKYIHRCIDSIINQTYTNLDIILVNDGSPDNCGAICEEYAKRDERIIVIHKENGGLSSARNAGLDIAKGDFIGFVDSDDWIELNMYEKLLETIIKYKADICICKFNLIKTSSCNSDRPKSQLKNEVVFDPEAALKTMFSQDLFDASACDKLYKRELFEQQIRYPFGIIGEDLATTYKLFHRASKLVFINEYLYNYNVMNMSIMRSTFNEKKLQGLNTCEEILIFTETNYPRITSFAKERIAAACRYIIVDMVKSNYSDKKIENRLRTTLRRNLYYFLRSKVKTNQDKVLTILCAISPRLLRIVFNVKHQGKKRVLEKV